MMLNKFKSTSTDLFDNFNNKENMYYGHGIGEYNEEIIDSIMNYGVRCSHGYLTYTSIPLGMGNNINNELRSNFDKWPHKDSDIVVIVSLPNKYNILESTDLKTYNKSNSAFYYSPSSEDLNKNHFLTASDYVMSEFVWGYYNIRDKSLHRNPKYYENQSIEEQNKLMDKIKQNYFNIIEDSCGIDIYNSIIDELNFPRGITDEEAVVFKNTRKKHNFNSIIKSIDSKILNSQIIVFNNRMTFREYINNYLYPYISDKKSIKLTNGIDIPIKEFIIENILYDCIPNYNGDYELYSKDKLFNEDNIKQNM